MVSLSGFKTALIAFMKGKLTFEQLDKELRKYLSTPNHDLQSLSKLLSVARDRGLPYPVYATLTGAINAVGGSGGDQDETVIPEGGQDHDQTALIDEDDDQGGEAPTVIMPEDSVSDIGAQTAPTVIAGDDGAVTAISGDHSVNTEYKTFTAISDIQSVNAEDEAITAISGDADETALIEPPTEDTAMDSANPAAIDAAAQAKGGTGGKSQPREIKPGMVLKDRFELLSKLGEGGMGVVYKAVDQLKVEAKDRNPYLAIKLLTGDFQSHPESFIALQRESSKAQKLAHPNIATVYDFDRDRGTPYLTMELLEGDGLNVFIKRKIPVGGLPEEEAMQLVEELAAGLSYAHEHNLVHSDLKPGNCWLTNDGHAKLLDFGIARASKTRADATGETTVFDPGQLGALTPAYATVEMFEGQDPDPRDDLYAMACIAYELFTGKHPFNKIPAPRALEKKLTPLPVPKLNKRQNKALQRGLALEREARTSTVAIFMDELRRKKSRTKEIVIGGIAALMLIGFFAYQSIQEYMVNQRNAEIIATIESGNEKLLQTTMDLVMEMDDSSRKVILEQAKNTVLDMYEHRAEKAVDEKQGQYNYPEAFQVLKIAARYYPDSGRIVGKTNALEKRKNSLLNELNEKFNKYLKSGLLLPLESKEDLTDVMTIIARVKPDHDLLTNALIPTRYADETKKLIAKKMFKQADLLLKTGLAYAPDNSSLKNLRFTIDQELKRIRDERLVAEIQQRLEKEKGGITALPDFLRVRNDLIKLAELAPGSPILSFLQQNLNRAFGEELSRAISARAWDEGEKLLLGFARLLEVPLLMEKRQALTSAETSASYQPGLQGPRAQQADKRKSGVTGLLAKPEFTEKWETLLVLQYKDLIAMLPPGDSWLQGTQNKISLVYLTQARKLRKKDSFPQALTMIRKGKRYLPGHPEFGTEHQAITAAETAHNKAQAEEARLAEIKGLKRTLLTQATADKILDARNTLEKLRKELPATDPFMAKEGPDAIGQAYMRLAKGLAAQKKFDQALKQADQGMALAPLLQPLAETRKIYAGEAKIVQLRRNFGKVKTLDVAKTKQDFARIKSLFPKRYPQLTGELGSILGKRIKAMEKTDVLAANDLLSSAKQLLPGNSALGKIKLKTPLKPSKYAARGNQAVNQGKLGQAEIILAEALKKEKDHPEVARFRTALEKRKRQAESEFAKAKQAIKFKKKSLAKTSLQKATSLWADNQAYRKELERISTSTAKAIKRVAGGGRPCKPGLAGYGTRARATCFDMLAKKQKGPVLVVVPTGSGVPKPFAISKYEISVSDFNLYCKLSGSCPGIPGKDGKLPVTNITLQQAEAYAKWLTEKTGNLYRLPKENEWAYAATAKGPPKKRDFNCRVTLGGNLIKGHAMMNVRAGVQNGWGLKHFLGNAQEWVMNGSGVVARGGAYTDPLSKCKLSLTRQHSGKADDITSFRLVMEIG